MHDVTTADLQALSHVNDTALLVLFGRASESRDGGVLHDPAAEALAAALTPVLAESARPLHRRLARGQIRRLLGVSMSLRARYFDDQALDFLSRKPGAVIVSLGCGLDGRRERLRLRADDPEALEIVDVDLPEMIAVKARVMPPAPGYRQIAADVTDLAWLDQISADRPLIFLAEGLLMYLDPGAVRRLVVALRERFPGAELVAEVFRRRWLEGWRGRLMRRKLGRNFDIDASAGFRFGISGPEEVASWADGIVTLSEWSFVDEATPRIRGLRWMRHFDGLRRLQWVIRWRLG